jgi:hypothetical protein
MKFSTVYHNYYCYCKNATRMIVVVAFLQFSSGKLILMSEVVANSQLTQINNAINIIIFIKFPHY